MSPFVSKAQQRWGNSPEGEKALGGPKKVAEWNNDTTLGLPERLSKTHAQKSQEKLARGMKGDKR
jgi:hypothetical protein